jgi:type VI secretion system secreted protein Hcp
MAADIFIKIGDYKGESGDDKHKEEIEVLSWSWGVSNAGSMGAGGGGGTGKASFSDITFMHLLDKASPNLMMACATGKHIKEATLTQRKSGETPQEYLVVKMSDVFITSVQDSGSDGGGAPTESVSLQFIKMELEYKPQKADGTLDSGVSFKWDVKKNVKL